MAKKKLSKPASMIKKAIIYCAPKVYIRLKFYKAFRKRLNEKEPCTLSEKIHCFMMHNRNPIYTKCADKLAVRGFVKEKLGGLADEILPTIYQICDEPKEFHYEKLPNSFVLKSNHSCGQVIICKDKSQFSEVAAESEMKRWLDDNYYYKQAEWQYKNIKPCLYAEKFLAENIIDYRIFCCSGKAILIRATMKDSNSKTGWAVGVYDINWEILECYQEDDVSMEVKKPNNLEKMVYIAEKLSEDFGFVRVDMYEIDGKPYFGELTFTPNAGVYYFKPEKWDLELGRLSDIKIYE